MKEKSNLQEELKENKRLFEQAQKLNKKNAKEKKTMFKEEEKQLKAKMKQLEAEKKVWLFHCIFDNQLFCVSR